MSYDFTGRNVDHAWHSLMEAILAHGISRPDRTGVGTKALFGTQLRFVNNPLHPLFPAVTSKKLFTGQVWSELAAFLRGAEFLSTYHELGCKIWDVNAMDPRWVEKGARWVGDVGRIYGVQWREWLSVPTAYHRGERPTEPNYTDQIANLVAGLKKDPYGRRHIVTALNPGELDQMCLPPCHVLFQCFVSPGLPSAVAREGARVDIEEMPPILHMRVDMRSVDVFIGLPFDIASYATLQALVAKEVGMLVGDLVFQMGDTHIYNNHEEQVRKVLARPAYAMPTLRLHEDATLDSFLPEHASLDDYRSHEGIKAPMNNA